MMLEPDPKLRATAEALLALPMLRQSRPWSILWYMAAEALSRGWALWQVSLVTVTGYSALLPGPGVCPASLSTPPVPTGPACPAVLALVRAGSPCQLAAAPRPAGYPARLTTLQPPSGQQPLQQLG